MRQVSGGEAGMRAEPFEPVFRDFPLERQMSMRKPAIASKRARSQRMAARTQRNKQAIAKARKITLCALVPQAALKCLLSSKIQNKEDHFIVENREAAPEAAALADGGRQMMRDNNPKKGLIFL
jgi:hypothetical protein